MVTSVPAWFGRKARTRKPPGVDVTNIVDGSGSMRDYIDFITSTELYKSIENALLAEGIGTLPQSENRYSFARATSPLSPEDPGVELPITVFGPGEPTAEKRWALGSEFLDNRVSLGRLTFGGEDVAGAANYLANFDRDYNPLNESIFIGGSDEQSVAEGQYKFDQNPAYPYRYVGIHSIAMSVREGELPIPEWLQGNTSYRIYGFVYTTDTEGVGIYFNFRGPSPGSAPIRYRDIPVSALNAKATNSPNGGRTLQENVDQAQRTNGAIYDIRQFSDNDPDDAQKKFNQLGESLGSVLGKYLYEFA